MSGRSWLAIFLAFLLCPAGSSTAQNRGAEAVIPSATTEGKVYALVVGVSKYKNDPLVPNLKFARADADAIVDFLNSSGLKIGEIVHLTDENASYINVSERGFDKITRLIRTKVITSDDLILIYLAGHGGAFNETDSYFFTYDSEHMQDAGTSLSIRDIKGYINSWRRNSKANVLFVFDACRSQTVGMGERGLKQASEYLTEQDPVFAEILFAASQGGEPAVELDSLRHGVFTYQLLMGLYGYADTSPKDGQITVKELKRYVENQVDDITGGRQVPNVRADVAINRPLVTSTPEMLTMATVRLNPLTKQAQNMVAANTKGGSGANRGTSNDEKAIRLTQLMEQFSSSLKKKNLIRPSGNNALFFYDEMKKIVSESSLEDFKIDLTIALYESAQEVIKHDLNGERLFMRPPAIATGDAPESSTSKRGYNLFYYRDAAEAMKAYIRLKSITPESSVNAIYEYLAGRQSTIEALERVDVDLIVAAITQLQAATKRFGNQAYLWQALAMACYENGRYDEALEAALKASELAPRWSFPLVTQGQSEEKLGNKEKALKSYGAAMALNPNDMGPYLQIGDQFFLDSDYPKAISYFRKANRIDPNAPITSYTIGYTYSYMNNMDSCLYFMNRALAIDSNYTNAYFYYAYAAHLKGMPDVAMRYYDKTIEADPNETVAYYNAGVLLSDLGRKEDAIRYYENSLKVNPDYCNSHNNLGVLYQDFKRTEEAEKSYLKAIECDPKFAMAYYNYGNLLSDQKKRDEAISYFKQALKIEPDYLSALNNLANEFRLLKRYDEAVYYYDKVFEIDPRYFNSLYGRGLMAENQKKVDEAVSWYRKALETSPKDTDTYKQLGALLRDNNRSREAIEVFKKSIEMVPGYTIGYNDLGLAHEDVGNTDEAMRWFQKAIQLDPQFKYGYYNIARLHRKAGKADEAMTYYKKAIEADPNYAAAFCEIAGMYEDEGRNGEAMVMYEKSIAADPNYPNGYHGVAYILSDEGKNTEAIRYYRLAVKADSSYATAFNNIGIIYDELEKYDSSEWAYREAIKIDPNYLDAIYGLGLSLETQKRLPEAQQQFVRMVELDPASSLGLYNVGRIYHIREDYDSAILFYRKTIAVNENHAEAHYYLASLLDFKEQDDEALTYYLKTAALTDAYPNANYNAALIYTAKGDWKKGVDQYSAYLKLDPGNGYAMFNRGKLYDKLKNKTLAQQDYQSTLIWAEENKDLLLQGWAHFRLGRVDKAEELIKQKLTEAPDEGGGYYDYACFYSLTDQQELGLQQLTLAVEKGYSDWNWMQKDEDLIKLRKTKGFKDLLLSHGVTPK
ncbi:MAG: tetratricopeptide repeat protein [Cyclobacteriaceae bacterium]|nr:tetratricopeptide repeat protein [Cyclobacteriaceae bacterium]